MGKIKEFILKYLDQMICIGGSIVIICLTLKLIGAPGSDYIFSASLIVEAFIFLLGAVKPGESFKEEYFSSPQQPKKNSPEKEEKISNEEKFFLEIQEEIKKINEKINERMRKNTENEKENKKIDTPEILKKINLLSAQVNTLFSQTKKIEEDFSSLKQGENTNLFSERNQEKTFPPLKKRGRPKKINFNNDK